MYRPHHAAVRKILDDFLTNRLINLLEESEESTKTELKLGFEDAACEALDKVYRKYYGELFYRELMQEIHTDFKHPIYPLEHIREAAKKVLLKEGK